MEARVAWFVMAHQKPEQLRWIVDGLASERGPNELILLHIDLKSMLGLKANRSDMWPMARSLASQYPNIRLMRPRFTNWGGWSLSRLHLNAIETALGLDPNWTHFVNLSGQCYPIRRLDEIRSELGHARDQVFVEMRHFSTLPEDDWHLASHPMVELPFRAIKRSGKRKPPANFELEYKGSQWSILPRAFCEWQRQAPVARHIRRYLRGLLLSDELLMQSLVRNGPWREQVAAHYGREIVWPGPKVMITADLPRLLTSPGFLARKFDLAEDVNILHLLAAKLSLASPTRLASDAT